MVEVVSPGVDYNLSMPAPKDRIAAEVKVALKAGDKERLSTLRLLIADLQNEALKTNREVEEAGFQAIVRRAIKQRNEAAEQFRKGNRPELAEKEEREAAILGGYLPRQASEDEIRDAIRDIVASRGLEGPAALGVVIKETLARFAGAADGALVHRLAREILAAG